MNHDNNLFERIKDWLSDSAVVILIFFSSLAMLLIGIQHLREDIYSTYAGIQTVQALYNIKPATWPISYWTMALSFSVGQVILLYVYLVDTVNNRRAFWGYAGLFLADTITDWYYRSNGFQFASMETGLIAGNLIGSIAITLLFYTLFSEIFLTMGFALSIQLLAPAITQIKKSRQELSVALASFKRAIGSSTTVPYQPTRKKVTLKASGYKDVDTIANRHKAQWNRKKPFPYAPSQFMDEGETEEL